MLHLSPEATGLRRTRVGKSRYIERIASKRIHSGTYDQPFGGRTFQSGTHRRLISEYTFHYGNRTLDKTDVLLYCFRTGTSIAASRGEMNGRIRSVMAIIHTLLPFWLATISPDLLPGYSDAVAPRQEAFL